jgi:hypothetical protein
MNYTAMQQWNTNVAIGAQASWYAADASLDPIYGNNPMSAQVYIRISPALMNIMK